MKYSNKPLELIRAVCVAAVFIFSVNACTEVDYRLGASLLPKNQRMKVKVDTLTGVQTYLYRSPYGIASSRSGYAYFGKAEDEQGIFGSRSNSFVAQFLPSTLPTSLGSGKTYESFGLDPVIDSIHIVLGIDSFHGDTLATQSFEIFEINDSSEKLSRDSVYYTDFPVEEYVNVATDKLFDFDLAAGSPTTQKLTPTERGKEFLRRLVAVDMEDFKKDSVFQEQFRGLYIAPAAGSPKNAAVLAADLSLSGLQLFMRIHDSLDVSAIYDTTYCAFSFRDTDDSSQGYSIPWGSVSVNRVDFEYDPSSRLGQLDASTGGFTDTLPTSASQPELYIQSMGGVTGFLRFTDQMLEKLQTLQVEDGVEHDIRIDQAMMYVWMDEGESGIVDALDKSIRRLGSYTDLKKLTPIPDYMYTRELQDSEYTLPYNGYLNRSNAYYQLDITAFVQQLAKRNNDDPDAYDPTFKLAPDIMGMFGFGQSVLMGDGSENPIKIRLTYTLIEKPEE